MKGRLHGPGQDDLLEAWDEMANLYPIEDVPYIPRVACAGPGLDFLGSSVQRPDLLVGVANGGRAMQFACGRHLRALPPTLCRPQSY